MCTLSKCDLVRNEAFFATLNSDVVDRSCALERSSVMRVESSGSYRACEAAEVRSFSPLWVALTTPGTLSENRVN